MYQCGEQEIPAWEGVEELAIMRGKWTEMDEVVCVEELKEETRDSRD